MTPAEAQILISTAAAFDNRKPDHTGVAAESWAAALEGVNLDDAKQAIVHHYSTSREWIMPADIRRHVTAIRHERVRAAGNLGDRIPVHIMAMDDGDEHTRALLDWEQTVARRIGDGEALDDIAPKRTLVAIDPTTSAARLRQITDGLLKQPKEATP